MKVRLAEGSDCTVLGLVYISVLRADIPCTDNFTFGDRCAVLASSNSPLLLTR